MTGNKKLKQPLTGIIPPMVTPLLEDMSLDLQGLNRLVEYLIEGGVSGLFILGSTGESTSLSYAIRHQLIKETCRAASRRVPVLVGITDTSLAESLSLAETAHAAGASAVVAAPPYYFNLNQKELFNYYEKLAGSLTLPLFLYNMPGLCKVAIEVNTAIRLSDHPNVIGLKDSSANSVYFQSLNQSLRAKPDFTLLVGPEEAMAESVLMGGHGGVSGGANMFPKLFVKLCQAATQKDFTTVADLQRIVMGISNSLYGVGMYSSSYLKSIKTALSLMNICQSHMAPPLAAFDAAETKHVTPIIEQFKLTLEKRGLL
jgi:2-dehydro-3-deoxy-D-pentonate aldolase